MCLHGCLSTLFAQGFVHLCMSVWRKEARETSRLLFGAFSQPISLSLSYLGSEPVRVSIRPKGHISACKQQQDTKPQAQLRLSRLQPLPPPANKHMQPCAFGQSALPIFLHCVLAWLLLMYVPSEEALLADGQVS